MPATELFYKIIGTHTPKLHVNELTIVEAELFTIICQELKEVFRAQHQNYFCLLKLNIEMENDMLEANFLRYVINDILLTEEYSLTGIACYTRSTEDVLCDVVAGNNTAPSLPLSRKIIELHRSVRPALYQEIMKKVISMYSTTPPQAQTIDC